MRKSKPEPKAVQSQVYQVDQSGKIEQTNRQTVVALANGKILTIKISAVEKQKLIKTMIELDRPKQNYSYKTFATLVFILLKKAVIKEVLIDTEYSGYNADIKNIILQLFRKTQSKIPEINFGLVGKDSNAHLNGISVFRNKQKADLIVTAKDILRLLYKGQEKGWRSRSSRDNP